MTDIKAFLDEWVEKINTPAYIEKDPVQFPLRYSKPEDIEVASFLTATITWGNRRMILNSAEKMFAKMGESPFDYILSKGYENLLTDNIHRTFFEHDLRYLCKGLNAYYTSTGKSLENVFAESETLWDGISEFRRLMAVGNNGHLSKHVSNPQAKSACKRLHLALRWLVRNDGIVDTGIWEKISPSKLSIPLDVHVGRISRELGLLTRNQNDRAAVESLTAILSGFCPKDPVKYDFALFGIGESGVNLSSL
ncbi:MAG TPA: TIGR02757 family protein [Bacteroidales bacterium]